jgi:hypothetical protein
MSIKKPIMRGTMIEVEGGKRTIWCPFEYEYCPNFCLWKNRPCGEGVFNKIEER